MKRMRSSANGLMSKTTTTDMPILKRPVSNVWKCFTVWQYCPPTAAKISTGIFCGTDPSSDLIAEEASSPVRRRRHVAHWRCITDSKFRGLFAAAFGVYAVMGGSCAGDCRGGQLFDRRHFRALENRVESREGDGGDASPGLVPIVE